MSHESPMTPLDPTQYRHFIVQGVLVIAGEDVDIFIPCHADDLPPGEAGATVIAERVRRHHATELGDPEAPWQSVEVREFDPPSEMYQVPKGTL